MLKSLKVQLTLILSACSVAASAQVQEVQFSTNTNAVETCRLLSEFPFPTPDGNPVYTPKDVEKVQELCALNIYPNNEKDIGVCIKNYNTQPALMFYGLPDGMSKEEFERTECPKSGKGDGRDGEKLAKHKQNVYGMQMDSGLVYFHLARLLGGAPSLIPVSTYRTIEKNEMLNFTNIGRSYGNSTKGGWGILRTKINRNSENVVVRPDNLVVKGALQENVKGEVYSTYLRGDSNGISSTFFVYATSPSPIKNLLNGPQASATEIENIQKAQDVTIAIFLDNTLQQNDRHSANVHMRAYFTYKNAEGVIKTERLNSEEYDAYKSLKKSKKGERVLPSEVFAKAETKNKKQVPDSALILERLLLKDNDDGLESKRPFSSYLSNVRHLNPVTFTRMVWLANLMRNEAQEAVVKNHFVNVIGISTPAYEKFKNNYLNAVKMFEALKAKGELHLDLSFEALM